MQSAKLGLRCIHTKWKSTGGGHSKDMMVLVGHRLYLRQNEV